MGTNGPVWAGVENAGARADGGYVSNGGELEATQLGGRRRRRGKKVTRKGGRKTRKSRGRRRTMRGGMSYIGSANVGHGYGGTGVAGMANHTGYPANVNGAGGPMQGGDGVYKI